MDRMARIEGNLWRYPLFSAIVFTPFFLPIIVLFWKESGLDLLDIYILQGLFAVAVVLLEVPTGMVADRLGKRTSLLMGSAILALGFGIYALSSSFWPFLLAEIVLALGVALYSGADSALLYDTLKALGREGEYKRREGQAKAIQMASVAIANLLGGFIGTYSFRLALWLTVIGPVIAVFVALGFEEVQRDEGFSLSEAFSGYGALLVDSMRFVTRHQLVRWQIAFYALLAGSSTWLLWMYQPYMKHSGLPVWAFGIAFAAFNLFAALTSRYAHAFEEKLGAVGANWGLAALQIAPLLLLSAFVAPLSFLFILGHQAVRGLGRPIISDRILRYTYADKRATVLSMSSLASRLFFALTAPLIGWLSKHSSIEGGILWQAALLGGLLALVLHSYRRIPPKYFAIKEVVAERQ